MALMETGGSTERELIWKELVTGSGQSYFQLAVSTLRLVGTGGGGLPQGPGAEGKLWSACQAHDSAVSDPNLNDEAAAAEGRLWSAIQQRDGGARGNQAKRFLNPERSNDLPDEVMLIAEMWPVVPVRDHKSDASIKSSEEIYGTNGKPLARTEMEVAEGSSPVLGTTTDGSLDPTGTKEAEGSKRGASRGSLSPAFAAWIQGYPPGHLSCAPSSSPKGKRKERERSKGTGIR